MNIKRVYSQKYPKLLKEINDPPQSLFVIGNLPQENELTIAIVGTRKASALGLKIAENFAGELAKLGFTIISGLAMGIDAAAHKGAISAGRTLAVLGNGIDKIYPAQNENLAKRILEADGAIVSEYPPGSPSYKGNFIQRNRIVSGLSLAVVVIEAPEQSGALSTAGFAASQGREVFVVPGPLNHPNYIGSHALIRDGARLVTSVKDIIDDLGLNKLPLPEDKPQRIPFLLSHQEELIINTMKEYGEPVNIDKIRELTKLEPQKINQILAFLVIKGLIKEVEGRYAI